MDDPDPGPSTGPVNENEAPEDLSTFRDQLTVANLETMLEGDYADGGTKPHLNSLCVPEFMDVAVYADSIEIGKLIAERIPSEQRLVLIASFYRLDLTTTMPVIQFCLEEHLTLVVLASAHWRSWDQAVPITVRSRHPILPCFPSLGLARHLGITLGETTDQLANGLFLVSRSPEKRNRILGSSLPKQADAVHDLEHIARTLQIVRRLGS